MMLLNVIREILKM